MIRRQEKEFVEMIVLQRPRMPLQPPYSSKEVTRRQEKELVMIRKLEKSFAGIK